ncbi:MAG: hypothetical protein NUW01_02860 [Gemmatimonadaceae bacterium]|nr:hypothetical protein [Gemmatimonadaceae bacterium]
MSDIARWMKLADDAERRFSFGPGDISFVRLLGRELRATAVRAEQAERDFGFLYDAVDDAEKFDTNAGDSAVSCVLAAFAERRAALVVSPPAEKDTPA